MTDFIRECISIYRVIEKKEADKLKEQATKWAISADELFQEDFGTKPDKIEAISSGIAHLHKDGVLFLVRPNNELRYKVFYKTESKESKEYQKQLYSEGDYKSQLGRFLEGIYNEKD